MAKVSLRIYNREIETMVDRGQLDEAIAHCRHILNTFPKNNASMMDARINMLKSAFVSGGNANKFRRLRGCICVSAG